MAGGETYRLSLLLEANDRSSAKINANVRALQNLTKESKASGAAWNKFRRDVEKPLQNKSASGVVSQIRSIGKEAAAAEKNVASLNRKIDGMNRRGSRAANNLNPSVTADSANGRRRPRNYNEELDRISQENGRRRGSAVDRLGRFNDRYFEPTRQIAGEWRQNTDALSQYTDEAQKLLRVQSRLKLFNLSGQDQQTANQSIDRTVKDIPGITRADATEMFTNAFNALNSVDAAKGIMPMLAKYQVSAQAIHGDKMSPERINESILKGMKFLELTGANKDRATMENRFDTILKVLNSTGGEVTFDKFLALGKQASPVMSTITDDGIRKVTSALDVLNGDRLGTALSALNRAWVGGVTPAYVNQRYAELGLIKPDHIEYTKAGMLSRVKPGGNILGDVFQKDPVAAAAMLREAIEADAKKKGISVDKMEDMNKYLRGLASTETQYRALHEFINNAPQLMKEASRAEKTMGVDQMFSEFQKSDLRKLEEYKAAVTNFKAEVGLPLLKVAGDIGRALAPIAQFAANNPEIAKTVALIIGLTKAVNFFGTSASIISNASGIGSSIGVIGSNAGKASTQVGGLTGKLKALPTFLKIGISLIALDFTWDQIQQLIELDKKYKQTQDNKKKVADSATSGQKYALDTMREQNVAPPRKFYDDQARHTLEFVQEGGNKNLELALAPDRASMMQKFYTQLYNPFLYNKDVPAGTTMNPEKTKRLKEVSAYPAERQQKLGLSNSPTILANYVAQELAAVRALQKDATRLNNPDTMASFRTQAPVALNLNETMKARLEEWLSQAFPSSFQASSGIMERVKQEQTQAFADYIECINSAAVMFEQQKQNAANQIQQQQQTAATQIQQQAQQTSTLMTSITEPANQAKSALALLPDPAARSATNLGFIPQPATDSGTALAKLAPSAISSADAMGRVPGATNGAVDALNGLQAKINGIQITIPPITVNGGSVVQPTVNRGGGRSPAPARKSSFNMFQSPASILFPSKASGGRVRKDGFVEIHSGEMIVPADVTRRYQEPSTFAALRRQSPNRNPIVMVNEGAEKLRAKRSPKTDRNAGSYTNRLFEDFNLSAIIGGKINSDTRGHATADERKSTAQNSSGDVYHVTLHAPMTVTNQGGKDNDIEERMAASYARHIRQIENLLAKRFDRGRERE